jgi:hypothetical protein
MNRLARSAIAWRALLALIVCVPAAGATRAEQGTDGVQVAVTVVPGTPPHTVAAVLTGGTPLDWRPDAQRLAMGLLVVDNRPDPGGWQVSVSQTTHPGTSGASWLLGAGESPPGTGGWPQAIAPRHTSAGQPLSRPTVILATEPGTAPALSWTPLLVVTRSGHISGPHLMLVSVAIAP